MAINDRAQHRADHQRHRGARPDRRHARARCSGPRRAKPGRGRSSTRIVPALLLCYFIPGIYNTIGLIDGASSKLYNPVASRVLLPAALVLLTLTIDLKGVLRLGPKLLAMYAAASISVMLGAFVGVPADGRCIRKPSPAIPGRGMAALAGSWIGGGANMVAMKEIFAGRRDDVRAVRRGRCRRRLRVDGGADLPGRTRRKRSMRAAAPTRAPSTN